MGTQFDATVNMTDKLPEAVKPTMTATVQLKPFPTDAP
jgi:hypothetical protein